MQTFEMGYVTGAVTDEAVALGRYMSAAYMELGAAARRVVAAIAAACILASAAAASTAVDTSLEC